MPIIARTGVKEEGFKRLTTTLPLSIPARLKTHAVTVVPILAPMITLMACFNVIRPEFTNPTTMTVVAEELCITAVIPSPVRSPAALFVVSLPRSCRRFPPALRSNACPIMLMPNRNRLNPPISVSISKIFICFRPFPYLFYMEFILSNKHQIYYHVFVKFL